MEAASRALKLNCVNSCRTTAYFIGVQQEKNAVTIWGNETPAVPHRRRLHENYICRECFYFTNRLADGFEFPVPRRVKHPFGSTCRNTVEQVVRIVAYAAGFRGIRAGDDQYFHIRESNRL